MSKGNSKSNNKSNGKSNGNGNSNGNSNGFLISENQNPEISAASTASLSRTFYVSLDNADKVIEGAPSKLASEGISSAEILRIARMSYMEY